MSSETNLEQSYLALIKFLMLSKRQVIEIGSDYDLTSMQAMTLFLLNQSHPMSLFKHVFSCDASNVTGLVDGLEQKSLACRAEDPKDRRIKMVQLQPQGAKIRREMLSRLTGPNSYILNKLSPSEVTTFIALVQKITAE